MIPVTSSSPVQLLPNMLEQIGFFAREISVITLLREENHVGEALAKIEHLFADLSNHEQSTGHLSQVFYHLHYGHLHTEKALCLLHQEQYHHAAASADIALIHYGKLGNSPYTAGIDEKKALCLATLATYHGRTNEEASLRTALFYLQQTLQLPSVPQHLPISALFHYYNGRLQVFYGKTEQAITEFDISTQLYEHFSISPSLLVDVYTEKAQLCLNLHKYREATTAFDYALRAPAPLPDPKTITLLLGKAASLYGQHDYSNAMQVYDALLMRASHAFSDAPKAYAYVLYQKGLCLFQLGHPLTAALYLNLAQTSFYLTPREGSTTEIMTSALDAFDIDYARILCFEALGLYEDALEVVDIYLSDPESLTSLSSSQTTSMEHEKEVCLAQMANHEETGEQTTFSRRTSLARSADAPSLSQ